MCVSYGELRNNGLGRQGLTLVKYKALSTNMIMVMFHTRYLMDWLWVDLIKYDVIVWTIDNQQIETELFRFCECELQKIALD
jgi:hypothetical protein